MIRKILVALDGSPLAERVLPPAMTIAQQVEGSIVMLRAAEPETMAVADSFNMLGKYSPVWPGQALEISREQATKYLDTIVTNRVPPKLPVQKKVIVGDPSAVIVDQAQSESVDLIALSSHGYSGFTRWMVGSVAERVLHQAHCPVLMIRSDKPIRHILIPLDGSPLSEQVVNPAFEVAATLGCRVTLMHSIRPLDVAEVEQLDHLENGLGTSMFSSLHENAELYLHEVANAHRQDIKDIATTIIHGSPAESILEFAHDHAVDVIAMSTHGRTGLRRWIYGSITDKVLRGGYTYSMLIVRPTEHLS
jgi:nucleotide-binding universal stress UspA family protein